MRLVLRRLRKLAAIAGSLMAVLLLWLYRPAWPQLPPSLAAPLTTASIEQITLLAAWVVASILVIVLLFQHVTRIGAQRRLHLRDVEEPVWTSALPRRLTSVAVQAHRSLPAEPKLFVIVPRDVVADTALAVVASSDPAAPQLAEPDHRPLVSLLGPLTIDGTRRSRRGLRTRALELIAFLALRREGAQRDEILEALWPGEDPKRSRHRFYQALRDARRLLEDAVASERDRYWLDRDNVRVDVDDFERMLAKAAKENRAADERQQLLRDAVVLVRGQPLAGLDYPWAAARIRSLRALMTGALEQMGHLHLEEGAPAAALALAERGIELDRYNEALDRLAMKAEATLQLRQAIIDRYTRLGSRLAELGLEPEGETRVLFRRLLSQS